MKEKLLLGLLTVAVAGGLYYWINTNKQSATPVEENTPIATITPTVNIDKEIALDEVAEHATKDDCWMVIEGKVYDTTEFISSGKHPGGSAILQGCGKDATSLFNTRPMGSKTPHTPTARSFLPKFQIGVLAK